MRACATDHHSLASLTLPSPISQKCCRHQHLLAFFIFSPPHVSEQKRSVLLRTLPPRQALPLVQSFAASPAHFVFSKSEGLSLVNQNQRSAAGLHLSARYENPADADIIRRAVFSFGMNKVGKFEGRKRKRRLCDRLGFNEACVSLQLLD